MDTVIKKVISNPFTLLIAGGVIGWLVQALLRHFDKPDLIIKPLEDSLNTNPGGHKFLHFKISNQKRPLFKKILFGERTALFCRAYIDYLGVDDGCDLIQGPLSGRWSSSGEPVLQVGNERHFQYNRVPELRFEHIMPGDSANLAVAIKINDDDVFYAFDNVSYAYLENAFRDPTKLIKKSSCFVTVRLVTADGFYPGKKFKICNPNRELSNFRIC